MVVYVPTRKYTMNSYNFVSIYALLIYIQHDIYFRKFRLHLIGELSIETLLIHCKFHHPWFWKLFAGLISFKQKYAYEVILWVHKRYLMSLGICGTWKYIENLCVREYLFCTCILRFPWTWIRRVLIQVPSYSEKELSTLEK